MTKIGAKSRAMREHRRLAILIDPRDNVATAVTDLKKGAEVEFSESGKDISVVLRQDIALGHKFAVRKIAGGTPVVKYGETIGVATVNIQPGQHVHTHNVEGTRGRGDKQ